MTTTVTNLRDLSPDQRAALARLRARKAAGIVCVPRDGGPLPCSFEQRRMWLSAQVDPDSVANVTAGLSLHGPLDAEALRTAVAMLVARHEVLRTVLVDVDGEPCQQILPELDAPLTAVDLTGTDDGEAQAAALARRAAGERFDLARAPLFRAHLYRLAAEEHRLLLVWHHAIADGWSVDNAVAELAATYRGMVAGTVPELPELPIQYADYAAWSRSRLGPDTLRERLSYWRELLAEPQPILQPGSPVPGVTRSSEVVSTIPAELALAVQRAGGARTTPYVAFLTAYQTLLARLTGERSVTVGTVTGGRGRTELEPLIGCFINLLPLRTELDLTLPFRDAAARVRSALGAAMANEVPFDELTSAVATARGGRMAALFQSTVIWQQAHAERQDWPADLATERWGRPVDEAAFDLVLIVRELPEDYELCFRYRTDQFAAPVVEQVASLFRQLLESIAAAPDAPPADLQTDADLAPDSTGPAHDLGGERAVGHRIEQGEIEAVLEAHPAVHQAAVVIRGERLVAYVVPAAGISTTPAGVVDHAAALLPSALVPTAWVALAALPRTPDGEVDRQALPESGLADSGLPDSGPAPRAAPVAARTATEELVASVLREVLERDVVSMDDDFFAIGGHSLLAMRVMASLSAVTEIELPVRILFTHSTVAELAAAVQDRLLTAGEGIAR